jgi:hypothetical protein
MMQCAVRKRYSVSFNTGFSFQADGGLNKIKPERLLFP